MAELKEKIDAEPLKVERIFEQPSDAVSFFCDVAQVLSTGNEVILQFYETTPGPPDHNGKIAKVRSRLRATVTLNLPHAATIGKLLIEKTEVQKK
jgi:hypothetical protein